MIDEVYYMRIKLPGSIKAKGIILLILIIISFGVLINEGIKNRARIEQEKKLQEQIIHEKRKSLILSSYAFFN